MTASTDLREQAQQALAFQQALADFVALARRKTDAHFAAHYAMLTPPVYSVEQGQKFVRVVSRDVGSRGGSVHCFVEKATGKIVKAAGWKAPAKRSNGELQSQYNVYDLEPVEAAFDPHGGYLYLR
jgi:hypothetical protein